MPAFAQEMAEWVEKIFDQVEYMRYARKVPMGAVYSQSHGMHLLVFYKVILKAVVLLVRSLWVRV
jgi:hypothetical protein